MSETLCMRMSTQNIACSQRQMNTCHTSFSYILWAYDEHIMSKWSSRTSDQSIWLVSEKKTEAVNAYHIKNGKGGGGGGAGEGSTLTSSRKDWAELYRCMRERERDTDRQTDRQAGRQAGRTWERQTDRHMRQTDRLTETETDKQTTWNNVTQRACHPTPLRPLPPLLSQTKYIYQVTRNSVSVKSVHAHMLRR